MNTLTPSPTIRETTRKLIPQLMDFAARAYGERYLLKAWEEFFNYEPPIYDDDNDLTLTFMPWYLFSFKAIGERNSIVHEFILENLKHLSELEREYLYSCMETQFSFYQVLKTTPGESLVIKDLLMEVEILIYEIRGSEEAMVGDIVFAKPVTISGFNFFEACSSIKVLPKYAKEITKLAKKKRNKKIEIHRIDVYVEIVFRTYFDFQKDEKSKIPQNVIPLRPR